MNDAALLEQFLLIIAHITKILYIICHKLFDSFLTNKNMNFLANSARFSIVNLFETTFGTNMTLSGSKLGYALMAFNIGR